MQWWDSDESQAPDMSLWRFGYGTLAAHLAEEVTDIRLGCRVEAIEVKEEVPMDAEPTAASSEEATLGAYRALAGGECRGRHASSRCHWACSSRARSGLSRDCPAKLAAIAAGHGRAQQGRAALRSMFLGHQRQA